MPIDAQMSWYMAWDVICVSCRTYLGDAVPVAVKAALYLVCAAACSMRECV